MNEYYDTLVAPDPELLLELFSPELFEKIVSTKLCLVVDDDGTISDSYPAYVAWLARELRRPLELTSMARYDFSDIDPKARGMLVASVFSNGPFHRHLPVIENAPGALSEIRGLGIAVILLTARPISRSMVKATYEHKKKNEIPFDLLIFSRRKREIVKALMRMKCRVILVDDDPTVIRAVSRLEEVVPLLFNALYNKKLNRSDIERIYKWERVVEIARMQLESRSGL